MTTLDKIKAEIQKVLDAEPYSENARVQALALFWVLELIDKYAEQEPTDEWQNGYDMAWEEAKVFYEKEEPTSPCDLCKYNPPSSADGKPCTMCPAEKGGVE